MIEKQIKELINSNNSKKIKVLEIGPGLNPTLKQNNLNEHIIYHTIDFINLEPQGSHHSHFLGNFLEINFPNNYEIIIDRCTLHEQLPALRFNYLNKIKDLLSAKGTFLCEHAIFHKNLSFAEDYLLYDEPTGILFKQVKNKIEKVKYIPRSTTVEKELINLNLRIIKFICDPTKKIVCNRKDLSIRFSDPDHLFFQLQKP